MKSTAKPQSATSLPRSPGDEVAARSLKYLVLMTIRIVCFVLMVAITPYGWYTWVFGAAAVFLPYIAVVLANVGQDAAAPTSQRPERMIETGRASAPAAAATPVIRVDETRRLDPPPTA